MKICIIGNGGSGKTTLALRLSAVLGIPCYHVDLLRFDDDGTPKPTHVYQRDVNRVVAQSGSWILGGNAISSLGQRLEVADALILLDRNLLMCCVNIIRRHLSYGSPRVERREVKEVISWDFIRYILRYGREVKPTVLRLV